MCVCVLISRQKNKGQNRNQYGQLILRRNAGKVQTFQSDGNKSKLNSRQIICEECLSLLENVSSCRLLLKIPARNYDHAGEKFELSCLMTFQLSTYVYRM